MKLPKELDHPRNGLINIQNVDGNECFKWCLVRYLKFKGFQDIKFPVKIRDIHKIEKKEFH